MPVIARAAYAEESAEVEVLLANTEKLKLLAKKIQGSIERLDNSGKQIQSAIKPIRGNTSKLQVTTNSENDHSQGQRIVLTTSRHRPHQQCHWKTAPTVGQDEKRGSHYSCWVG